jgi:hypothetical protein
MERAVYAHSGAWDVTACVQCGTVSVTSAIVEEPRPHDVRCLGHEVVPIDKALSDWLSEWALRVGAPWGWEWGFLPAKLRLMSAAELAEAETTARAQQEGLPRIERLRRSGVPRGSPPPDLPRELQLYRHVYEATALRGAALPALLAFGATSLHGFALFEDQVRADPGLPAAIEAAMLDPTLSDFAFELARRFELCTSRILEILGEAIARITTETRPACVALYLAGGLGRAASSVVPALEAAAARVDRNREYYFHKLVVDTAARCRPKRGSRR